MKWRAFIASSLLLAFTAVAFLLASPASRAAAHDEPSASALSVPGALGRIEYKPSPWRGKGRTTYWIDTDGMDPGTAGCHIEVDSEGKAFKGSRVFGEACKSKYVLIESNPGRQEFHPHQDDLGHPDLFDCRVWCQVAKDAMTGACHREPAPGPCGKRGIPSAKCVCTK